MFRVCNIWTSSAISAASLLQGRGSQIGRRIFCVVEKEDCIVDLYWGAVGLITVPPSPWVPGANKGQGADIFFQQHSRVCYTALHYAIRSRLDRRLEEVLPLKTKDLSQAEAQLHAILTPSAKLVIIYACYQNG